MKFEMTLEGCAKATEWLKENGHYEEFMNNGFSVDGYSLVATANYYRQEQVDPVVGKK